MKIWTITRKAKHPNFHLGSKWEKAQEKSIYKTYGMADKEQSSKLMTLGIGKILLQAISLVPLDTVAMTAGLPLTINCQ
jgi:hypothetical protein